MSGGPSSRVRFILIPLCRFLDRFKCKIILLSLLSLSFLPLFKDDNFILTHSLLSESALDKVTERDIEFSSRIQPIIESNLLEIYNNDKELINQSDNSKIKLAEDFSQFIPYNDIKNGVEKINQGYINILENIILEIPNIEVYIHKFVYENRYKYSIFIILKCKRCVPFFSNLTVCTMDKDSTLSSSLLLGVMSSLSDKQFLSQNHYYLFVHKDIKFNKAVSAFLKSFNYDKNLSFHKHNIQLSHVLDFDNNCSNSIYLHYEGINGYKPPLDWSVAALKEFIRHGIDIQTLPIWESFRRQAFNVHLHEQHSTLMEYGIPSFTIASKCSKNKPHSRSTLLRALHVLSRDQGNMDESMDECINYYTFTSNKHFISLPHHLIPSFGLISLSLYHVLSKPYARNPKALFYGFILYIMNILLLGLFPYLMLSTVKILYTELYLEVIEYFIANKQE